MSLRFGVAFMLLGGLLGGNYYLAEEKIKVRESMSGISEKISHQRMMAQRMALLSKAMVGNQFKKGRDTFRQQLLKLTDQLEKNHHNLIKGSMSENLPLSVLSRIKSIYTDEPYFLKQNTEDLISAVRSFATLPDNQINDTNPHFLYVWSLAQSDQLVQAQDLVVQIHQAETKKIIERNVVLRKIQLSFLIGVLVFITFFVFVPMVKRIKKEMDAISEANNLLDQKASDLILSNQKLQEKESSLVTIMEDLALQKKKLQKEVEERIKAQNIQAELLNKLERANKDLNDFAHVVSHDLKAPLRGIGSMVDWLYEDYADKFDDNGKRDVHLMKGRIKRMHEMIGGLLELAKVGRTKEGETHVDVRKLITEVIDFLSPPKDIQISISPGLPTIKFEKPHLQQVFQNILSNAIKYMDKPKKVINIGYKIENGRHMFSIQDNGPGIDERFQEKVFGIFETLKPHDSYESTGIGLSLVKKIIEEKGGKIWFESELGKGTTFKFYLPQSVVPKKNQETFIQGEPSQNAA